MNNKNLIKVAKLPKPKLKNTNNNLESKFKIYINDNQTDNSSLINSELNINRNNTISSYNDSYIPNVKLKKNSIIRFGDNITNIGIRNIIKVPKTKININAHNYSNVENKTGNKNQKTNSIIPYNNSSYKNDYFSKTDNIIKKNNNYKANSVCN